MNIRFRSASVRYYDTRKDDGGAYCRIYMTARADSEVRKKMGWGCVGEGKELTDPWPSDGERSGKLLGTLSANNFILTPKDTELRKHEIDVGCNKVSDFAFTVENDSNGNRKGVMISFVVRSSHPDASIKIDRYFRSIQDGLGDLKIDYIKQENLPLEEVAEETEK
jgi:hypothetical protein